MQAKVMGRQFRREEIWIMLIHFIYRQKPLQYCKVISLQLIKINGKKNDMWSLLIQILKMHVKQ